MDLSYFVHVFGLNNDQVPSIDVWIQHSSPEPEIAGGLGHKQGVGAWGQSNRGKISIGVDFEVFVLSVIQNTLNYLRLTLNLYTPGYE